MSSIAPPRNSHRSEAPGGSRQVLIGASALGMASTGSHPSGAVVAAAEGLRVDFVECDVYRTSDGTFVVADGPEVAIGGPSMPYAQTTLDAIVMMTGRSVLTVIEVLRAAAEVDLGVHLALHLDDDEGVHEEHLMAMASGVLPAGRLLVSSGSDRSVEALRDWAVEHDAEVRVGLAVGSASDSLRVADLFPGRRVARVGADFVVGTPRLASVRLMDWAKDSGIPLIVDGLDDQRGLGKYASDNRVWMVQTAVPHLAPRHRAAGAPVGHNVAIGLALTTMLLIVAFIVYLIADLSLHGTSGMPGIG